MTMQTLVAQLEAYAPSYDVEKTHRLHMLHLAKHVPNCLNRKTFAPGHFTASAFVSTPQFDKVLMLHHATLQKWMQPGGHADDDPELLRGALREVEEELGLQQADLTLWNHGAIFDLDCHAIPHNPKKDEPEHIHFDVRFLLICAEREIISPEGLQTQWWPIAEGLDAFQEDDGNLRAFEKLQRMAQNAT